MAGAPWGKFAVAMLAVAAALLVAAPSAGAEEESEARPFDAFVLEGSNGYRIQVLALFQPGYGESSEVAIWVARKGRAVFYLAPAVVTDTRIDADLGELGRIALEFQPTGTKGVVRPSCAPEERYRYDQGSYVGEFELRGEEGYTTARATRIAHRPHFFIEALCGTYSAGEAFGHGIPGARLTVHARLGQGRVSLQVNQNRPDAPVRVEASIEERRGRIEIERGVLKTYSDGAFEFAPDLRFAALRPDAPFSGTGAFRRGAKRPNRWTGSLTVDFPGRSNVSLTGDRFRTKLLHARLTEEKVREGGANRPNLSAWPSTKPSPTAFATFSSLAPR